MSIVIDTEKRIFTQADDSDKSYTICFRARGFSGNPYEMRKEHKGYSLDGKWQSGKGRSGK